MRFEKLKSEKVERIPFGEKRDKTNNRNLFKFANYFHIFFFVLEDEKNMEKQSGRKFEWTKSGTKKRMKNCGSFVRVNILLFSAVADKKTCDDCSFLIRDHKTK